MKQREKKRLQADWTEHLKKNTMAVYTIENFSRAKQGIIDCVLNIT